MTGQEALDLLARRRLWAHGKARALNNAMIAAHEEWQGGEATAELPWYERAAVAVGAQPGRQFGQGVIPREMTERQVSTLRVHAAALRSALVNYDDAIALTARVASYLQSSDPIRATLVRAVDADETLYQTFARVFETWRSSPWGTASPLTSVQRTDRTIRDAAPIPRPGGAPRGPGDESSTASTVLTIGVIAGVAGGVLWLVRTFLPKPAPRALARR